jgi:hypothetical protein
VKTFILQKSTLLIKMARLTFEEKEAMAALKTWREMV